METLIVFSEQHHIAPNLCISIHLKNIKSNEKLGIWKNEEVSVFVMSNHFLFYHF